MDTRISEIADGIYRLSTFVRDVGPTGFMFNQFLINDERAAAVPHRPSGHVPLGVAGDLRGHAGRAPALDHVRSRRGRRVRGDERVAGRGTAIAGRARWARLHGVARTTWPTARPSARRRRGHRPRRQRVRHLDTPHVPHGWEARLLFEETTGTLLCGDLFTQLGDPAALVSDDIVGPAGQAEDVFRATCLTPSTGPTIRRLAELAPTTLAVMHGSCYTGDAAKSLLALADDYDARLAAA